MALRNNRHSTWTIAHLIGVGLLVCSVDSDAIGADYRKTEQLFFQGDYNACAAVAAGEVQRGVWNEKWPGLLLRCQLATGKYEAAAVTYEAARKRFKNSIGLRMIGAEVYRLVNRPENAQEQLEEIVQLVRRAPWRYSSSMDRVTLGRFFLLQREDARDVLEMFYDRARRSNPNLPEVFQATAELALEKHDYQEAAKSIERAIELQPNNPDLHLLSTMAWQSSDQEKATASLQAALKINPKHVPSLLHQVDHLIDAEQYKDAEELLTEVLQVNLRHAKAWAYLAVIAHLQGHYDGERQLRAAALSAWNTNPHVDSLIGSKLSRKYRFAEAAAYQRRALKLDPNHVDAKFQLSQDLLRLGDERQGWQLADEVHEADGYNVVAYNLVTLRDEMDRFATLETDKFRVRMDARESRIYGPRVLALLNEAHEHMCNKYNVTLDGPVTVEIFPNQKDFAIRTFGLPGGAGFLGVCFGRVITANSPASQGESPTNWRSVLWHEFCHVVTLEKTRNRMPRWLSEGISVYEEQEKNPSWGERLTPTYRQMILGDDLTPVSQLSSAFLSPKTPTHLQFAYFEAGLVVRYLVEEYGVDVLNRVLTDLSVGMPINTALARYVGSLERLDSDFVEYAQRYVREVGPEVDWEISDKVAELGFAELRRLVARQPYHYQAATKFAALAIKAGEFQEAERVLAPIRERFPQDRQRGGVLAMLARVYREQGQSSKEREVLKSLVVLNDRAIEAYARLAELAQESGDWKTVRDNAQRYIAVQPLLPRGHELLATAAKQLDDQVLVARALTATLEMDPVDPAGTHFEIAQAHHLSGEVPLAKRHVLMALEHAPRYRAAQRLLLRLVAKPTELPPVESNINVTVEGR